MKRLALLISIIVNLVVLIGVSWQMYALHKNRKVLGDAVIVKQSDYNALNISSILLLSVLVLSIIGQIFYFLTGRGRQSRVY